MSIYLPFNYRPESTSHIKDADGEQTVPSGKYHRVTFYIFHGGLVKINGDTIHTTEFYDQSYHSSTDTSTGAVFTGLNSIYRVNCRTYSVGTLPSIYWDGSSSHSTLMVLNTDYYISMGDEIYKTDSTSASVHVSIHALRDTEQSGYFWVDESDTYEIDNDGYMIVEQFAAT